MLRHVSNHLWTTQERLLIHHSGNVSIFRSLRSEKSRNRGRWSNSVRDSLKLEDVSFGRLPEKEAVPLEAVDKMSLSLLVKPALFTTLFCSASFVGATIWQYENMRKKASSANALKDWFNNSANNSTTWFRDHINQTKQKQGEFRRALNAWWSSLSEGERIYYPILFVNVLVLGAWKVPSMHSFMTRYFTANPVAKAICWPMFLSAFSHYSFFHCFANMFVLHSFSSGIVTALGKEQFLAFYCSAAVISSFTSHIHKLLIKQRAVSLGASGAVMAVIGYICTKYPDTLLNIMFLPFFTFKAGSAIKAIIALDTAGVLFGWKIFDHAAHLGGALFGISWYYWGSEYVWKSRGPLLEWWHNVRTN